MGAPPPALRPAPRPSVPARMVAFVVVGVLLPALAMGALAVVAAVASSSTSSTHPPPPRPLHTSRRPVPAPSVPDEAPVEPPPPPPSPDVNSRICMVADRSGDGVRELVALVGDPPRNDGAKRPAIIDGASGALLWVGASAGASNDIYLLCAGDRWVGILDDASFVLRLIPLDTPEREARHVLTDEVFYYGATQSCLRLRTDDGRRPSFSLTDGSERSCDAPLDRRPHISHTVENGIIRTLRGASAESGGVDYRLTTRRPGTPFLEVSASQRGRELWRVPLRFIPVGGEAIGTLAIAATPGVVVVLGSTRGGPRGTGVTAVGLNAEGGTERFATTLDDGDFGHSVGDLVYNDRFVVARTPGRLVALDPTTGSIAWTLGD